jgi:hypothetical protein
MTFAMITPALIVGAFAERMKFSALMHDAVREGGDGRVGVDAAQERLREAANEIVEAAAVRRLRGADEVLGPDAVQPAVAGVHLLPDGPHGLVLGPSGSR